MSTRTNIREARDLTIRTTCILFLAFVAKTSVAQLPDGKNNIVYSVTGTTIYNYDPTQAVESGINPRPNKITLPAGAKSCLAVSKNLNAKSPATTFYTIVEGIYYYYDGTQWINTGHRCGNTAVNNINSGGNYLYNSTANNDQLFIYNGKENSALLTKVDLGGNTMEAGLKNDHGKFYVLKTKENQANHSSGSQTSKTGASGIPNLFVGGGFAIVNGHMYVTNLEEFNAGSDEGNSIIFESAVTSYPASALKN